MWEIHKSRFDERDVETEVTVEPLRHRQTKEAATDLFSLKPPRHIPTLPNLPVLRLGERRGQG